MIATLYSAENPVPALSISGPAAKKNPGTADSERKEKYMAVCAAGRVFIIIAGVAAVVVVVGCEFGSRITAVGCLLEPDNVVFVYC